MVNKKVQIDTLTSLRFIAVCFIFLSHLSYFTNYDNLKPIFNNCFYEGYFGVTFFFILSGFVLCYNYYGKVNEISLKNITSFTKKRMAHVYPIHIITLLNSVPLLYKEIIASPLKSIIKGIINILLLQSFVPIQGVYFSFNAVSWNLSSLLIFYILFPVILMLCKKITSNRNNKVAIIYILALMLGEFILVTIFRNDSHSHWLFYISPFFRLADCTIGVLLAILYLSNKDINMDNYKINALECISLLLISLALYNFKNIAQVYRYGIYYLPFLCLIIYIFSFQNGVISRILKNKVLVYLGNISFSFYMIHQLVIRYVSHVKILKDYPISMAYICFLISLVSANILYKYFENPLRKKVNLN